MTPFSIELPDTGAEYAEFYERHREEIITSALEAIDPTILEYDEFIRLAGACETVGQKDAIYRIAEKDPRNKGTLERKFRGIRGSGRHGEAGEGTIFDYAKKSGWKWPAPADYEDGGRIDAGYKAHKAAQNGEKGAGGTNTRPNEKKPAAAKITGQKEDFTLSCIMDSVYYTEKPNQQDAQAIRGREPIPTPKPAQMSIAQFAQEVTKGRTFYPCIYNKVDNGRRNERGGIIYEYQAQAQQIFVVDIDNEQEARDADGNRIKDPETGKTKKIPINNPLTIEKALEICKANGTEPFFYYETFSSKAHRDAPEGAYTKFRLCFATDRPLTAQEYGERGLQAITQYFIKMFGEAADSKTTDAARIIYGTNEPDRAKAFNRVINGARLADRVLTGAEPAEKLEDKPELIEAGTGDIDEFFNIVSTDRYKAIPTGIDALDRRLSGGFVNEWLIIINAAPGAGKTVLATQICENMARSGRKCLYFNFEMSKDQLIARSLARIMGDADGMGALDILRLYKQDQKAQEAVFKAGLQYKQQIAPNMLYNPDGTGPNLDRITEAMEARAKAAEAKGNPAPVICIDYLQMIEGNPKEDIKETIKRAVYAFKKYAEKHHTIVICISAQSRAANNDAEARQDAGRDTSNIEYSADLQMQIMSDPEDEETRQLYITKSRFAAPSLKHYIAFHFNGKQGRFIFDHEGENGSAGKKAGNSWRGRQ